MSNKSRGETTLLWTIILIAFALRFVFLGLKPPHFDEGINGWFVDQTIARGYYPYDPTNYHGPFHFYLLLVFKLLMGRNLWALRVPASLFGLASVYLVTRLKPYVGKFVAYSTAFFMAVSPAMTFYSRYSIHESELLFFSILSILGYLRFTTKRDRLSLWQMGLGVAGMAVTKETFIMHVGCFLIALLCLRALEMFIPSREVDVAEEPLWTEKDLYSVIFVSCLLVVAFYSGFFLNMEGVLDFFRSFAAWFQTGQKGNGHEKPFFYWFKNMADYEVVAMVGLVLSFKLIFPSDRATRLIGIYGFGVFLAYSIVPYKTPWCIIQILWPLFIVAASILADFARHSKKLKYAAFAIILALGSYAFSQSISLNFYHFDDEKIPYVYVQTFSDLMKVYDRVHEAQALDQSFIHKPVKIFVESTWPLPWIFGDFTHVVYMGKNVTDDVDADLIIADEGLSGVIENRLTKTYFVEHGRLRSAQGPIVVYYRVPTFEKFFPADAPKIMAKPPAPLVEGPGVLGLYFTNPEVNGIPIMKKVLKSPNFRFDDKDRPLPAPFGMILEGEILIPEKGERNFFLTSDDGSQLSIDGKVIITNYGHHADLTLNEKIKLSQGWHAFKIQYNDFGGGMSLRLQWAKVGLLPVDIPEDAYRVTKKNLETAH